MTATFQPLAAGVPVSFTLTTLSDWHVGIGRGQPGGVDRLVWRDHDRLPCVPATTLVGVWRDACEVVAAGLDGPAPFGSASWTAWVDAVFGVQQPMHRGTDLDFRPTTVGRARISPARLPDPLRLALAARPQVAAALTFLKPGVKVDDATGAAANKMLRYEEMAAVGLELSGSVGLADDLDDDGRLVATALLVMGALHLERLGAKRRRGAGRVRLRLDGAEPEAVLEWVGSNLVPPPAPPPPTFTVATDPQPAAAGEGWLVVDLVIELRTPVAVHHRTVGNTRQSLDHVPGSILLPSVLGRLRKLSAALDAAARVGELIVTNATPEVEGAPGRPLPAVVVSEKRAELQDRVAFNRVVEPAPKLVQTEAVRARYAGQLPEETDSLPAVVKVDKVVHTHNVIEDAVQRPTEKVGGVYSIEAIDPCQPPHPGATHGHRPATVLRAQLRLRPALAAALPDRWWTALDGKHHLGRKTSGDYGLVEVTASAPALPPSASTPAPAKGDMITVWFLSDALVRDRQLRPSTSPCDVARALGRALRTEPALAPVRYDADSDLLRWASRANRSESWHRGWNLARPTMAGVGAGTVGVFEVVEPVPPAAWADLAMAGFGERRAEGFGQVAVDDILLRGPLSGRRWPVSQPPDEPPAPLLPLDSNWLPVAQRLEQVAWRAEIERRAEQLASDPDRRKDALGFTVDRPPATQAGALRALVGRLDGPRALGQWLELVRRSPVRAAKWSEATITRIERLADTPSTVFDTLGFTPDDDERLAITVGGALAAREALAWHAIRALIVWCVRSHVAEGQS